MANFRPYYVGKLSRKMLKRLCAYILLSVSLMACWSVDPDKIAEEITWPPSISVPLGYQNILYEDEFDIPGYPIFPNDPTKPVTYIQREFLEFNMTDALAKREYIDALYVKVETISRFPADIEVDVFYRDNGVDVSLIGSEKIEVGKAEVDPVSGRVLSSQRSVTNLIDVTDQIDNLSTVNELIIEATVKELLVNDVFKNNIQNYTIRNNVGARAELTIKTN